VTGIELALGVGIVIVGLWLIQVAFRERGQASLEQVLADIDGVVTGPLDEYQERLEQNFLARVVQPVAGLVTRSLSALLPSNHLDTLRHKIVLAGRAGSISAEEFLSVQVLAVAAGFVIALIGPSIIPLDATAQRIFISILVGIAVAALPNARLSSAREDRVDSITKDLPDALDLLAISVEAGVSLESGMAAVTDRFDTPLGHELGHVLSEMELGVSRAEALRNLSARTEVPDLSGFVLAMVQADALGMPMSRTLKTQSEEMRRRRRQRAREAAAKLPVKLLFPLMMFILPSLFIVILGPAAIRIADTLLS
jgi:tight adherence protein C